MDSLEKTSGDARVTVGVPTFNRSSYLGETMASILRQSYGDFRLLICDNASEDDTTALVASFADPRVDYVRSESNLGMLANLNRVIDLAATEYLAVVPDDDLLYPDHLRMAVDVLDRHPNVGLVHTGFDLIDESGRVLEKHKLLLPVESAVTIESSAEFLERGMQSRWTLHWGSALFRRSALVDARGFRVQDEPLADLPLLLRVGSRWDVACLSASLAAYRVHASATTAAVGCYTGRGYDLGDRGPDIRYGQRLRFLAETSLAADRREHYFSLAGRALRRDRLAAVANAGGAGASWAETWKRLARLVYDDPRTMLVPTAWRICAAQLGARHVKRIAQGRRRARAVGTISPSRAQV
jgi:glycosyltransferase involved in cell wall biosynthesis